MSKKDIAPVNSTTTDNMPVQMSEAMAAAAAEMAAGLQDTTDKISTREKLYKHPDGTVFGPIMEATILGFVDSSSYYPNEAWDPNNIQEPVCYADAINNNPKVPAYSIEKPMNADCESCPYNEFKSSKIGQQKGKRCKEEFRVVLIPEGTTESVVLSIPPTGRKGFAKAIKTLIKSFGIPSNAIARFEFNPNVQYSQPIITTAKPNPNGEEHFAKAQAAIEELIRV